MDVTTGNDANDPSLRLTALSAGLCVRGLSGLKGRIPLVSGLDDESHKSLSPLIISGVMVRLFPWLSGDHRDVHVATVET